MACILGYIVIEYCEKTFPKLNINCRRRFKAKTLSKALIILSICVIGTTASSFLMLSFRKYNIEYNKIDPVTREFVRYYHERIREPVSIVLAFSSKSYESASILPQERYSREFIVNILSKSMYPEMLLQYLSEFNNSALIYANLYYDRNALASSENYVVHLFNFSPTVWSKTPIIVKEVPCISPPKISGSSVVLLSTNVIQKDWFLYDILSLGNIDYTSSLFDDIFL